MAELEKTINGLECCTYDLPLDNKVHKSDICKNCPYYNPETSLCLNTDYLMKDALELLKEQHPKVLTLEEVKEHFTVPISKADIGRFADYAEDIKPLYFEFPYDDEWVVHWRGYDKVRPYLNDWSESYGKTWRCWTDKPTDEQRKAEPWKVGEQE